MKAINNTLLQMLFYKPIPQQSKSIKYIYSIFKERIFPGEENYIHFLEADTLDEQMQYAIKILKRLSFESNFPPPYNTLLDVVSIENAEKNVEYKKDQHIARDHFLHISYLYMLGIYVFFYDKLFFEKIKDAYKFRRKSHEYENKEYDCIKDFLSAWKYFCLYHDVGYSIEKLSNSKKRIDLNTLQEFSYSFDKNSIGKEVIISSTVKALSHIVIVKHIVGNSHSLFNEKNILYRRLIESNVTSFNVKNGLEHKPSTFKKVMECCEGNSWRLLDKMYSNSCLKLVLSVFRRSDFMVLAFNKNNGKQAFCLTPNENGSHSVHLFEGCRRASVINEIIKTPELVFYDDYRNNAFTFQFYLNVKADNRLISSEAEYALDLDTVVNSLPSTFNTEYVRINGERDMHDFYYSVYGYFNDYISSVEKNSDLYNYIYTHSKDLDSSKIYSKSIELVFSKETKDNIYSTYFKLLSDVIQLRIDREKISIAGKLDITSYVSKYVDIVSAELEKFILNNGTPAAFSNFRKGFVNDTSNKINSELESRISILKLYSSLLRNYIDLFSHHSSDLYYNYSEEDLYFKMRNFWDIANDKFKKAFGKFENNVTVCEIAQNYNVPFGNKYDHGIVSSYLYAFVSDIFIETISNASPEQKELLSIAFNFSFDNEEMQDRFVNNYRHIQEDVFYALFIHNISPSYFDEKYKKYRTSVDDPFSYLGMLADSLQQWNRPHTIHPSVLDRVPNIDSSNEYDIQIEDDFLVIYEINNKEIQEKLAETLYALTQYLENPDAFVKYGYSRI